MSDLINYYEAATQQASASDLPSNGPIPRLHPGAALTFSHFFTEKFLAFLLANQWAYLAQSGVLALITRKKQKLTWSRHAKFVILKKC